MVDVEHRCRGERSDRLGLDAEELADLGRDHGNALGGEESIVGRVRSEGEHVLIVEVSHGRTVSLHGGVARTPEEPSASGYCGLVPLTRGAQMNAVVIHESLTGNTEKAAEFIAVALVEAGIDAIVCSTAKVDYQALADADLVVVGSWTDGLFLFGQKPARSGRLAKLPFMTGKRCAVFCTYAIENGRTLEKLTTIMEGRGADVIGGYAIRRNALEAGAQEFVDRLLGALAV